MKTEIQIFAFCFLIFMWLISTWAALAQFTRGRLRKIELKNKELFKKAEQWVKNRAEYEIVIRFLSFFAIAVLGTLAFSILIKAGIEVPVFEISIIAGISTFILVAIGEVISRMLVTNFDIQLLIITMPIIKAIRFSILYPLVALIEIIHKKIERPHMNKDEDERASTEDEILSLVEINTQDDKNRSESLEEEEKMMIKGIFDLDKTYVREIMTPRVDLVAAPIDSTIEEVKKIFIESGHSRIPIYKENIDDIKGIVFAKDFLDEQKTTKLNIEQISHVPVFIPETKAVDDLLQEFKKTHNHFAVVIDEYGGTAGIVTLEDIIEEIIGDVNDEHDSDDDKLPAQLKMPDGTFVCHGRTLISEVNEIMELDLPDQGDIDTIGGYICAETGRIPEQGEIIPLNDQFFATILKADKRKIIKIKLHR